MSATARKQALRHYFSKFFPAHLVLRLLKPKGVCVSRRFFLNRPPNVVRNSAHVALPATAQDLAWLFVHESNYGGQAPLLQVNKTLLLDQPWFELHLGWLATVASAPLAPSIQLRFVEFELVFDIDLPDYDKRSAALPLRSGFLCYCALSERKRCCQKCWLLLRLARVALEQHVLAPWLGEWGTPLWVFSGGKGTHCIFGSTAARTVTLLERATLKNHLDSFASSSTDVGEKMAYWRPIMDALLHAWEEMGIKENQILARNEAARLLGRHYLSANGPREEFEAQIAHVTDSLARWRLFVQLATPSALLDLIWCLGLPPVDTGPLANNNGAIKAPFSVHKDTRRIALPLSPKAFATLDPETSVTVDWALPALEEALREPVTVFKQWLDANNY